MPVSQFLERLFSSKCQTWETPQRLFKYLDQKYNIDIDLYCDEKNTKKLYLGDANLIVPTNKVFYANPPYNDLLNCVYNCISLVKFYNNKVILLVPNRPSTQRFKQIFMDSMLDIDFYYFNKRLSFELNGVAKGCATFDSILIVLSIGCSCNFRGYISI